MRTLQIAIQLMHLLMIEIVRPRASKDRKAHFLARIVGKRRTGCEHPRNALRIHSQLHRHPRPLVYPPRINPLRGPPETAARHPQRHRLRRVQAHFPRPIAQSLVDPAVMYPYFSAAAWYRSTARRPRPTRHRDAKITLHFPQRRKVRRQIQQIMLRPISLAQCTSSIICPSGKLCPQAIAPTTNHSADLIMLIITTRLC